ncbi:MAG: protein-disulfide reductase DsbD domain-containing protein [Pseudomonadota bacterium]
MSTLNFIVPLVTVSGIALAAGQAPGQSLVSTGQSFLTAALLPGAMAGGERLAGLEMVIVPGWKTYWRSPGEAGVPPRFDWSASGNLAEVEVLWPRPEMFESFGMMTIGYGGRVVLPIRLVPEDPDAPIEVALALEVGVCADICVFENTVLEAVYAPELESHTDAIAAAHEMVPPSGLEAGVLRAECRIEGAGRERAFSALLELADPPVNPYVVIEGTDEAWFHDVEVAQQGAHLAVRAGLALPTAEQWITRKDVRMTVFAMSGASDIRGCAPMQG